MGWRSETYHTVILVTDSADPLSPTIAAVKNALIKLNIVPIFVSPATYYSNIVTSLQFGVASTISSDYSDLLQKSFSAIKKSLSSVWTVVDTQSDVYGFSQTVSAAQSAVTVPANLSTFVTLKYPTANPIYQTSSFNLNQMGWGTTTISNVGMYSCNC